jgi:hypothetical protein
MKHHLVSLFCRTSIDLLLSFSLQFSPFCSVVFFLSILIFPLLLLISTPSPSPSLSLYYIYLTLLYF